MNNPGVATKWDGRTRLARAVRKIADAILYDLGSQKEVSPVEMAKIERAAELLILAAEARSKLLRGKSDDLTSVVRIENAAQRALSALGTAVADRATKSGFAERIAALRLSDSSEGS